MPVSVLRRMEEAAREAHGNDPSDRRAFLDLLGRVIRKTGAEASGDEGSHAADEPRLIVP